MTYLHLQTEKWWSKEAATAALFSEQSSSFVPRELATVMCPYVPAADYDQMMLKAV